MTTNNNLQIGFGTLPTAPAPPHTSLPSASPLPSFPSHPLSSPDPASLFNLLLHFARGADHVALAWREALRAEGPFLTFNLNKASQVFHLLCNSFKTLLGVQDVQDLEDLPPSVFAKLPVVLSSRSEVSQFLLQFTISSRLSTYLNLSLVQPAPAPVIQILPISDPQAPYHSYSQFSKL